MWTKHLVDRRMTLSVYGHLQNFPLLQAGECDCLQYYSAHLEKRGLLRLSEGVQ